ncbi:hypothetical protein GCM10018781_05420 [Kitasatospora indigofera]|uniref:DUF1508 domain-containing protein n=1 Tax=Kitasatospora indigofera TaxID=67307 RepID=A0A919KK98_9ACTN|nr:hypothetical protein GCM10018781_05420 [Kitasatospora indigofera]
MDASARGRAVSPGLGKAGPRGGFRTERGPDGRYRWQLKASNGRLVAVSPAAFETPAEAERSFENLRAAAPELVARITHVRDGIGWIWVVPGARGLPEIRSSRPYERYATCQNAFRRFVVLLGRLTEPAGDPAQHPSESRRLRPTDAR